MSVRAKFYVSSIEVTPGYGGGKVNLQAATRGARNTDWASATPSGSMEMQVNNPDAFAFFMGLVERPRRDANGNQLHPEVFITIEAAQDGIAGDGHPYEESEGQPGTAYHQVCAACGQRRDDKVWGTEVPAHPNG